MKRYDTSHMCSDKIIVFFRPVHAVQRDAQIETKFTRQTNKLQR